MYLIVITAFFVVSGCADSKIGGGKKNEGTSEVTSEKGEGNIKGKRIEKDTKDKEIEENIKSKEIEEIVKAIEVEEKPKEKIDEEILVVEEKIFLSHTCEVESTDDKLRDVTLHVQKAADFKLCEPAPEFGLKNYTLNYSGVSSVSSFDLRTIDTSTTNNQNKGCLRLHVKKNVTFRTDGGTNWLFLEEGASVSSDNAGSWTIFLKKGAQFDGSEGGSHHVICEPGAKIINANSTLTIDKVRTITFDLK